jgi:hypothetical protein
MNVKEDKKGFLGYEAIIVMVVAIAFLTIAIRTITDAQDQIDEPLRVATCKKFNEIRYGLKGINPLDDPIGPNACRTISKTGINSIPTKEYQKTWQERRDKTLGSKREIRDMVKNCWNQWLEGTKFDMFNKFPIAGNQKCFVCYTFSIKDKADEFTFQDFDDFIDEPLDVVDLSDQCAAGGGGKCTKGGCTDSVFSREVIEPVENKCKYDEVCCITQNRERCIDKGGKCLEKQDGDYVKLFTDIGWNCDERNCYVKEKSDDQWIYFSYRDYIQKKNGFVTYGIPEGLDNINEVKFTSDDVYAVTFISPGPECGTECYLKVGGTIAGIGTLAAATVIIPGGPIITKIATSKIGVTAAKPIIRTGSKIVMKAGSMIGKGVTSITAIGARSAGDSIGVGVAVGLAVDPDAVVGAGVKVAGAAVEVPLGLVTDRPFTNMILVSRLADIEDECKPMFGDE